MTQTNEQLLQVVRDHVKASHSGKCNLCLSGSVLDKCSCGRDEALSALTELEARLEEAETLIRGLCNYGMISPVVGVQYPEGPHTDLIGRSVGWLVKSHQPPAGEQE